MEGAARLTYYEYIESQIPTDNTIIMIHGLAADSTMWDLMIPFLDKTFNILRYDLPEHGKSDPATSVEELTWAFLVEDLNRLVRQLHIKKSHMISHGFGGTLALEYSRAYPTSVQTLTLISMHMTSYYTMKPGALDFIRAVIAQAKNAQAVGTYLSNAGVEIQSPTDEWMKRIEAMHSTISAESYIHLLMLIANTPTVDYIKNSSIPMFLIFGSSDPLTPQKILSHLLTNDLADKRTLVIPNAHNWVQHDHPELVANQVCNFIWNTEAPEETELEKSKDLLHSLMNVAFDTNTSTQNDSYDMELTCLGGFRVTVNDVEVLEGWNRRFAKDILLYLVLHGGATREELTELLWSHADPAHGKAQLRVALSHLRKVLNISGTNTDLLVTDHVHVSLKRKVHCDVIELQKTIQNTFSLDGMDRANAIERIFADLPAPPLFSGMYHEAILQYWYGIESKLQELSDWCLGYYSKQGSLLAAAHFKKMVSSYVLEYE